MTAAAGASAEPSAIDVPGAIAAELAAGGGSSRLRFVNTNSFFTGAQAQPTGATGAATRGASILLEKNREDKHLHSTPVLSSTSAMSWGTPSHPSLLHGHSVAHSLTLEDEDWDAVKVTKDSKPAAKPSAATEKSWEDEDKPEPEPAPVAQTQQQQVSILRETLFHLLTLRSPNPLLSLQRRQLQRPKLQRLLAPQSH